MWTNKTVILISFICLLSSSLFSQNSTSPYSSIGLGDVIAPGYISNSGMGGVGISNTNIWSLNSINPALLSWNSFNVFEFGISGESRKLSTIDQSTTIGSGSLEYVAIGIPITSSDSLGNRWSMALSLKPYSVVNYSVTTSGEVIGESARIDQEKKGEGGINSFSIDNGVKLGKNLSVGLKSTYLFGPTVRESSNSIFFEQITEREVIIDSVTTIITTDTTLVGDYTIAYTNQENSSGFVFEVGALYTYRANKKGFLNLGITYFPEQGVTTRRFAQQERQDFSSGVSFGENSDTLFNNTGKIVLPSKLGAGLSYSKIGKWVVAGDIVFHQWENYRNFDNDNEDLQNVFQLKIGGEITPDITSIESYLKRVTYKLGLDVGQTPYLIDDTRINEFGINFGISLPVSNASRMNIALKYGQRGTKVNGLIREEYFKVSVGASFNGSRWKKLPRFN